MQINIAFTRRSIPQTKTLQGTQPQPTNQLNREERSETMKFTILPKSNIRKKEMSMKVLLGGRR
jgi:hypothetical protein